LKQVAAVDEFRRFADGLSQFVWTQLPDGRIDWANRAWYDFVQLPHAIATTPAGWAQVIHPDDLASVIGAFTGAIDKRSTYEIEHRVKPATADASGYRWVLARSTPQFDEHGNIVYWFGTGTDIHDARMRAVERAALLSELSEKEAESFRTIADYVPQMMWSARPDGWMDWYNHRWYDYTGQTTHEAAGRGWRAVQHPEDLPTVDQRWADSTATGKPFETELRMRRADGVFRMFLVRAAPQRDASGAVIRWFGTCTDIDNEYRMRMRERTIARTFQDAALELQLPNVPSLSFDAMYAPAQSEALIGGDWFDAFRLIDGRVVMSVGDVAGSGLKAAVTMASLRQSIRTASLINPDPIAVLDAVDRIVRDMDPQLFATAFVAVFDPVHAELRYASAGHPPPLVRHHDGRVTRLDHMALPLGLRQRDFALSPSLTIEPGMLLVMYTDGLTEVARDPVAGEANVSVVLTAVDAREAPAHAIYNALVDANGPHDDIALLTVYFDEDIDRRDGTHGVWSWSFDASDVAAARATQRTFAELLASGGMPADDVVNAELVFAELIGNVLRYASRIVHVALDRTGESPVLHVLDQGGGFEHKPQLPTDILSERGRGLYIVSHLSKELSITRLLMGGSHMRAVLAATHS
jgi:PAS domain S-box-containing protein